MEGFLTSAGTKIRRNHQHCNQSSGCMRVWLMLLETQIGRWAESAQAGRGSLLFSPSLCQRRGCQANRPPPRAHPAPP